MKICICGGGSLGTVCAGVFVAQGHEVRILSGHPERWSDYITVTDCNSKVFSGNLSKVSDNPKEVIPNADIVLLCIPGYLIEKTLREIKDYLNPKTLVGSIVSSTGFFFIAHVILDNDTPLFGFQRVPFIARVKDYGKSGLLLGYKDAITVAYENVEDISEIKDIFSDLFLTTTHAVDNYLKVSLTNSNPILHTGRLYAMWKESNGLPMHNRPLFYSDWTDLSSEIIIEMDNEFQHLLEILGISGAVPTLLDYYESSDGPSLTNKIRSIQAFKTIESPMIQTEKGWKFDFGSRYFTEDFPYGLKFIRDLAIQHNLQIPTIDKVYNWGISKI
ncbi:MAG: NAD(P)-binding domain-containing protein [Bacteroidales bacterium]|nr:NAD(P)-binding domain-containing protein [Bacteroidales bacterium]